MAVEFIVNIGGGGDGQLGWDDNFVSTQQISYSPNIKLYSNSTQLKWMSQTPL